MGTISDKLMRIINTKEDIRQALILKGYDVPTSIPFKEYAKMISDLPCKVDDFPKLPGDVIRWHFGGLTNEMMAAMDDPRIEDADGKGRFLSFKNFAWKEGSGISDVYPGALVFDGVDDWAGCDNLPLLPKEKGYSIIALRNWITRYDATQYKRSLISNLDTNDEGAFLIEYRKDKNVNDVTGYYNSFTDVYIDDNNPITWQTSSSYNGQIIKKGTSKPSNKLCICKTYFNENSRYANAAIWELVILDHDATEEELTKIKDYFVKTYPWLFPDQAWTVVGKTNEDEDRATIANITGNGNDLVLSNFGFAEGSGYGLYKTPFELYPSVQHSSKYSLSFSKFALGDHNLIIAPKQNDLSYDIKVKVTGLKDGVKFKWGWIGTTGYIDITTDGIHMLNKPASQIRQLIVEFAEDFDPDHVVTIEQIPEYEGYLVTDGVDDRVQDSSFKLNKDWTLVGEWVFLNQKATNAGITKPFSFVVYNRTTGLSLFINTGTSGITIENVKSIKAICSDGRIYFDDWSEMLISKDQDITSSTSVLSIGFNGTAYTQMAFKNLGIYNNQLLSKDDCIKAYNYLQTLKSK